MRRERQRGQETDWGKREKRQKAWTKMGYRKGKSKKRANAGRDPLEDHGVGCPLSTIIGWSDSLCVLFPHIIRGRRGPSTIINALFGHPPVRGRGTSPLIITRRTTPSPSFPVIPVVSLPFPISVFNTFPLTLTAATRTAGPFARPISWWW